MPRNLLLLLPALAACDDLGGKAVDECTIVGELGVGRGSGLINDIEWEPAGVTWLWAGDSLQFNAPPANGWTVTMVAMSDTDGTGVKDKVDAEDYPIHVAITSGEEGGFATVYPAEGDSYVTDNAAGGMMQILRQDEDSGLVACFDFEAGTDGGEIVTLTEGQFRASPM